MPAGTAGNRVDCGLGCLIEKHWHDILVYGLIGIAGLLILHAARATCREHLVKRRIVRALLGPKERRVVPTADDPTGNSGLARIPRCTAPVPRGPGPIRYAGEIERRAVVDGRRRAGPRDAGPALEELQQGQQHGDTEERAPVSPVSADDKGSPSPASPAARASSPDKTVALAGRGLARAMEDALESRARLAQPELFVKPPTLRQKWRVRQEQSSAAVRAERRGSYVAGKGIFAASTGAQKVERSLPLPRRVYWENEETLDCFSHPVRPSSAAAWELISQSDSCSCGSSGSSSSSSSSSGSSSGGGSESESEGGKRADSAEDAAAGKKQPRQRKPKHPKPTPDPALLLLPRRRGRSAVYRNAATQQLFLHPVEAERRRLRRLRRARREQEAYLALEAAERERREAPAKARAERAHTKAAKADAAMEARFEAAAAAAEEKAEAEEEEMQKWEKHTAEKRLAMEARWGDMSFAKRMVEEAEYDKKVEATRAVHTARKEKRQAAIAAHAEQMAARRKAAEVAAVKRQEQAAKSAAVRAERFSRVAAKWREDAAAQKQLDVHGVPYSVPCRGERREQTIVFWWPNRLALLAAQRRRYREATQWLPLRGPKNGRVFWFNPRTGESLSGPRVPQSMPCWSEQMDILGHMFLEGPLDTRPDPFAPDGDAAPSRPRLLLNKLPAIAYEEQRRAQWASASAAAVAARAAVVAATAAQSVARAADGAAWGAEDAAQTKKRRTKREAVLRRAISAALPGMNKRVLRFIAHLGAEKPTATAAELMESEMASLLVTGGAADSEEDAGPACSTVERCTRGWYEMQRRIDMQEAELRRRLRELVDPAVATAAAADDEPTVEELAACAGDKSEAMLAVDARHRAQRRAEQCSHGARIQPQVLSRIQAVVLADWNFATETWTSNQDRLHYDLSPALCGVPWQHSGGEAECSLLCSRIAALLQRITLAGAAARADEAAICAEVADIFEGLEETDGDAMEKVTAAIVEFRDIPPADLEKKIGSVLIACDFVGSHTLADEYCEAVAGEDSLVVQQTAERQAAREVLEARIEVEEVPLHRALEERREHERSLGRKRTEDAWFTARQQMAQAKVASEATSSLQAADAALRYSSKARAAAERVAAQEHRVTLPDCTFQLLTSSMHGVWPP